MYIDKDDLITQFFKVFGVEPKWKDKRVKSIKTYYTEEQAQYLRKTTKNRNIQLCYSEITAEKLLEMICIYPYVFICNPKNIEEFRTEILKRIIAIFNQSLLHKDEQLAIKIRYQIQQLFKGEE